MSAGSLRVIVVVGARPNFVKVAPIVRAMAAWNVSDGARLRFCPVLVHTGQHYDPAMSSLVWDDVGLPEPDYFLGVGSGSHAEQTAAVMVELEKVLRTEQPHLGVVVGDVNSTLAAALVLKINSKLNFGAIVVFLVGIAFILVAGNHVQSPGTVITLSEKIHRDSAIAIVIMSPLACYLLAPSLKASGHRGLWIYSMIAGTIAVLTIVVGFLIPTGHSDFLGIFERILLLNGQVWGEIICVRLIWTAFKPKPTQAAIDSNRLRLLQIYANSHSEEEQ